MTLRLRFGPQLRGRLRMQTQPKVLCVDYKAKEARRLSDALSKASKEATYPKKRLTRWLVTFTILLLQ